MPKRPIRKEDLLRFVFVGDPQISPDGDRVLFSHKTINDKNKYITNLFTVTREGKVAQWTQGDSGAGHGRWSPDGAQIAFISSREDKLSQLYVLPTTGGEARKLTTLPEGSIGEAKWSPDGKRIAITFREQIPSHAKEAEKERQEKGLSTPPIEITSAWYRLDGDGYFADQRYKLYAVDVATGEHKLLYEDDVLGDYDFDWSPDSQEIAVIHNATKKPWVDPPNKQIYRLNMEGQSWRLEGLPKGEKALPRWSPDGKWIAYIGDVDESDPWGTRNLRVYLVAAGGGEAKCLTEGSDFDMGVGTLGDTKEASSGGFDWAPDGKGLLLQIGWHGEQQLGYLPIDGEIELLTEGRHVISIGNISRDGSRIAALVGNATTLQEVAVIERELASGHWAPSILTDFNHAFHEEVELSSPE